MKWNTANRQTRLRLVAALILVIGLGGAAFIYLTADKDSDSSLASGFENSKKYHHDLELYGGEMTVLTDDLSRWFGGLWQGESLAYTVACITVVISGGCWLAS